MRGDKSGAGTSSGLDDLNVTALRIFDVVNRGSIPGTGALVQDIEVVAVKMHRMGGAALVFDDYAHAGVVAEIVNVPLLWGQS